MRHENFVRGVTTAASLWFVTVLGLAFGSGQFALGCIGVTIALLTLFALPSLEKRMQKDSYGTLTITTTLTGLNEDELKSRIEALGLIVKGVKLNYDLEAKQRTFSYDLKFNKGERFDVSSKLVADLSRVPEVRRIDWV